MSIRIKLFDEEYFFMGDSFDEAGAIAPLDHCDNNGELLNDDFIIFHAISFAHYFPDTGIMRYCEKIGDREDMLPIKKEN